MMRILFFSLIFSVAASANCFLRMDSYNGTLYDFVSQVYKCPELKRSFAFDMQVERQLPVHVSVSYSAQNYASVLDGVLRPLGLHLTRGRVDMISLAPKEDDSRPVGASPSFSSAVDSSGYVLSVSGDSARWVSPREDRARFVRDSLRRYHSLPVPVRLQLAFFSADTLNNHGIDEPDFIASIQPKIGKPVISLYSYALKLHLYNDTLSDHQDLHFELLDTSSLVVGPRTRYSDASYSNGTITSTSVKDEQFGLSCSFVRKIDMISYSCSYARNSDTRDLVQFSGSLFVGSSAAIAYGLDQYVTTRGGGLFWLIPFLSDNHRERVRYVLSVVLSSAYMDD